MKKKFLSYAICWLILLALFHVVVFATPNEIGGVSKFVGGFWVGYGFTLAAFLGQLACAWFACKANDSRKLFYRLSPVAISSITLVLIAVVAILCMTIPQIPAWIAAIVCSILSAFVAISVLMAKSAAEVVSKMDEKIAASTSRMKELTAKASVLMANAQTPELKAETKKVYEALRYSDPMSNEGLSEIEAKIASKLEDFERLVVAKSQSEAATAATELLALVNERAAKCKLLK